MADRVIAYVGIGSNIEPQHNIPAAVQLLNEEVTIQAVSSFYKTPALERPDDPHFLNGVAKIEAAYSARTLKFGILRGIEAQLGRERTENRYGPRTIDLDLLLYDDLVCHEPGLQLPDKDIERPFVGLAILELNPELVLPDSDQRLVSHFGDENVYNLQFAEEMTQLVKRSIGL